MDSKISMQRFERLGLEQSPNLLAARRLSESVLRAVNTKQTLDAIAKAHVFNASSHEIQKAILNPMQELGFASEKKGLFAGYSVSGIRPDYFKQLDGGGVLFEVERGKTIANNMDLLDIWKTHICAEARHLFLFVPKIRVDSKGKQQNILTPVSNRVEAFFAPNANPIDIDSVSLFGY